MLNIPAMELQDQPTSIHQALVFIAAVSALAAEEPLVPPAARLHIGD
jgi:hypothetical protein